jgi:hypothetical protein
LGFGVQAACLYASEPVLIVARISVWTWGSRFGLGDSVF